MIRAEPFIGRAGPRPRHWPLTEWDRKDPFDCVAMTLVFIVPGTALGSWAVSWALDQVFGSRRRQSGNLNRLP